MHDVPRTWSQRLVDWWRSAAQAGRRQVDGNGNPEETATQSAWNAEAVPERFAGYALPARRLGCLLVHGLGSTPACMRELAEYLVRNGIEVEAVLLPGHGTRPEHLRAVRWQDWAAAVSAGLKRLRARADRVFVLGQSLGGSLALHCAAHEPVDGIITLAAVAYLRDWRIWFLPVLKPLKRWRQSPGNDIARDVIDEGSYDRLPLHAIQELLQLARRVRGELARIPVPALIVHGRDDHVAPVGNADYIHQRLRSENKELLHLDMSYHVITLDHDREFVAQRVLRFIRSVGRAEDR